MAQGFDPSNGNDLRLLRMALKKGWPISESLRAKTVNELEKLLDEGDSRDKLQAAKTLIQADAINQRRERDEQDANSSERYEMVVVEEIVDARPKALPEATTANHQANQPAPDAVRLPPLN